MTISRRLRIVAAVSAAFCCLAMAVPAGAQESGENADTPSLNPLSSIPPSSITGFTERPLFSPLRRKPEPVATETEEAAPEPESLNIRLLGVIVTPQGAVARIVDLDDDARYSLREGEPFRDWSVASVKLSGIVLSKEDMTREFSVFKRAEADSLQEPVEDPEVETAE